MARPGISNRPFTLRRLRAADADAYRALRLEGLKENPEAFGASFDEQAAEPLSWFEATLENNVVFGGFSAGGELAGVAGFHVPLRAKSRHKGVLWGMYVTPDARGTGLARQLTERVIEHAETVVEELLLRVVLSNPAAVTLYKSLGFAEYGVERRAMKIGADYYDEVLMALPLGTSG